MSNLHQVPRHPQLLKWVWGHLKKMGKLCQDLTISRPQLLLSSKNWETYVAALKRTSSESSALNMELILAPRTDTMKMIKNLPLLHSKFSQIVLREIRPPFNKRCASNCKFLTNVWLWYTKFRISSPLHLHSGEIEMTLAGERSVFEATSPTRSTEQLISSTSVNNLPLMQAILTTEEQKIENILQ